MKKTLLILLLQGAFLNIFAYTTINSIFFIDLGNNLECTLLFYSNAKYKIIIENNVLRTITRETVLSCGAYTEKGSRIILQDFHIGLKMQCERCGFDELRFVQGFTFLLSKTLKLLSTTYEPDETIPSKYDPMKISKERDNYKKSHQDPYKLYYSQYSNGDYVIDIQKEYKYVLRFNQLILSEGTWKKEGNALLLFDKSIQYAFTVLIGKEGLFGRYLPGNFYNLILYEKSYPFKKEISTVHVTTYKGIITTENIKPGEPFSHVEVMPQFPNGGDTGLRQYLKKNTKYTDVMKKGATKNNVVVRFVIEKDGSIGNIEVQRSMNEACDKEAIRVIKSMPKWIPGKQNGVPVAVYYTIAVNFD